jgi:hypothetical protein
MRIELDDKGAPLVDPDDFAHFSVRAPSTYGENQITAALQDARAGYLGIEGAMISVTWIRAQVLPATRVWIERFQTMLAFADSRGWLADGGESIQAHIESPTDN